MIRYKYNKPIRYIIFNFNQIVSDLDIHANTSESRDLKDLKCLFSAAGHVIKGHLKIISDS